MAILHWKQGLLCDFFPHICENPELFSFFVCGLHGINSISVILTATVHKFMFPGLFFKPVLKVPIAPSYKGICLQNTSKPHPYHLKTW